MSKKKFNSLSDLGGFVYSTNENEKFSGLTDDEPSTSNTITQYLEAHFSTKGRGGKIATVITGFKGSESDLKDLAKLLKIKCGVSSATVSISIPPSVEYIIMFFPLARFNKTDI